MDSRAHTEEKNIKSNKFGYFYLTRCELLILLLVLLVFFIKELPGKLPMSDLAVYLEASRKFWVGTHLYDPVNGGGFYRFKYPPTAPVFFLPLAFIPFWIAKPIFGLLQTFSLIWIFRLISKWANNRQDEWMKLLLCISFGGLIHYELHLGQVTLLILLGLLLSIDYLSQDRPIIAAFLYSCTMHLKPFGWPLILWGILRKKGKFIIGVLGFAIIFCFVQLPFYGLEGSIKEWQGFIAEMSSLTDSASLLMQKENHVLASVIVRWFKLGTVLSENHLKIFKKTVNFLLLLLVFYHLVKKGIGDECFEVPWFLAIVPLIGPSEYKYFQLVIPLAGLAILKFGEENYYAKVFLILGLILIGINIYDLWGRTISRFLSEISIITLGGLSIFIAGLDLIRFRNNVANSNNFAVSTSTNTSNKLIFINHIHLLLLIIFIVIMSFIGYINESRRCICKDCLKEMAIKQKNCKHCGSKNLISQKEWKKQRGGYLSQ